MSATVLQVPALGAQLQTGPAFHRIVVPGSADDVTRLGAAIEQAGVAYDARAIWVGFPNLQRAAILLLQRLSAEWPHGMGSGQSAAIRAVLNAVDQVRAGMARQERTREQITANFLHGLAIAAEDSGAIVAWGFKGLEAVESFQPWSMDFRDWCESRGLTEVRFYRTGSLSSCEGEGERLKLLCAVSGARDVGIATRFRTSS